MTSKPQAKATKQPSKKQAKPGNPLGINNTKPLTPKQLHYCRCRASGTNMSDSYREAYNTTNMANKTINEAACVLDKHNKITKRIDYLIKQKEQALIRSEVGLREKVLTKLEGFMDTATTGDTAKIRAAELLGKSIGLFKEVLEDNRNVSRTPEELTALLEAKLASLGKSLH